MNCAAITALGVQVEEITSLDQHLVDPRFEDEGVIHAIGTVKHPYICEVGEDSKDTAEYRCSDRLALVGAESGRTYEANVICKAVSDGIYVTRKHRMPAHYWIGIHGTMRG